MAQPGHLQTSTGYLRIGLDLRILTVPKNPDFRFRIGRKLRKTEKTGKLGKLHVTYQIKACGVLVHADTLKSQNSRKILGKTKSCALCIYIIFQNQLRKFYPWETGSWDWGERNSGSKDTMPLNGEPTLRNSLPNAIFFKSQFARPTFIRNYLPNATIFKKVYFFFKIRTCALVHCAISISFTFTFITQPYTFNIYNW